MRNHLRTVASAECYCCCMRWWCCIARERDDGVTTMGCATSLPLGHRRHSSVASQPNNATPDNHHHEKGTNNSVGANASSGLHIVLNQNDRPSTGKQPRFFSLFFPPTNFFLCLSQLIRAVRCSMSEGIPGQSKFSLLSYRQLDQSAPNWTICRRLYNNDGLRGTKVECQCIISKRRTRPVSARCGRPGSSERKKKREKKKESCHHLREEALCIYTGRQGSSDCFSLSLFLSSLFSFRSPFLLISSRRPLWLDALFDHAVR